MHLFIPFAYSRASEQNTFLRREFIAEVYYICYKELVRVVNLTNLFF